MATRLGPHLNTQTYIQRSYRVNGKGIANVYTACVLLGGVYTQQNADLGRYGPKTSPDGPLDRKISNDDDDNGECRLIASDIYLTHNPLYIKSTCNRKTYIFAQKKRSSVRTTRHLPIEHPESANVLLIRRHVMPKSLNYCAWRHT